MDFKTLVLTIVGNIFIVVFVIRAFGAYMQKERGEMIQEVIYATVFVGFIYFTDQVIGILKVLWNLTFGTWFGVPAS